MLYTSSKVYKFPNFAKTCCKTSAWSVGIPFNERRYWWADTRSMMLWVSYLSLRSLLYSILKVSSFCRKKVVSCKKISELFTGNYSSRIQKNSPTRLAKAGALIVGGMFVIATMICWGERCTKVSIESGLLSIVPWSAMVAYSATWKAMAMAMA